MELEILTTIEKDKKGKIVFKKWVPKDGLIKYITFLKRKNRKERDFLKMPARDRSFEYGLNKILEKIGVK